MRVCEGCRLRELEAENARLKRLLAERDFGIDAIKDVLRKHGGRTAEAAYGARARRRRDLRRTLS